jgi:hypothetical protein
MDDLQRKKNVYSQLSKRRRIPRGKFSETYNFIFGIGEGNGMLVWLLVGHRSNAQLMNIPDRTVQGGASANTASKDC